MPALLYTPTMPRLWDETIAAHRQGVRQAIMNSAAALAAEHGLLSLTMSQIAEQTGIGRATLYKYFSSVEDILRAWHDQQIQAHLEELERVGRQKGSPRNRLRAVLTAYAEILHGAGGHGDELGAFLHNDKEVAPAQHQLQAMVQELLEVAAETGEVRTDIPGDELASYCIAALGAARRLPSRAAARRLAAVVVDGLLGRSRDGEVRTLDA